MIKCTRRSGLRLVLAATAFAVPAASLGGCADAPGTGTPRTVEERIEIGAGLLLAGLELFDALRADEARADGARADGTRVDAAAEGAATEKIAAGIEVYCGLSDHGRSVFLTHIPAVLQAQAVTWFGGSDADVCTDD